MTPTPVSAADKRELARRVGRQLEKNHGRKKSYAPYQVSGAMRELNYPLGWDCWALSLYASAYDFGIYHAARGESCDYQAMQATMLSSIDFKGLDFSGALDALGTSSGSDWSLTDLFSIFDSINFWD
jgi:hypothetical protein